MRQVRQPDPRGDYEALRARIADRERELSRAQTSAIPAPLRDSGPGRTAAPITELRAAMLGMQSRAEKEDELSSWKAQAAEMEATWPELTRPRPQAYVPQAAPSGPIP